MCGILGVVYRDPQHHIDEQRLAAARDTLEHRGPDEKGLWSLPGVGLAHRRLSILDLAHGQQPWVSPDNNQALVYNGEVYNYRAIRDALASQGTDFQTNCDTEAVFHTLALGGSPCHFNGMFALGFYDHANRALRLIRDRLGQKPLYWADTGDALIFASELKAILAYTGGRYELDPVAVEQFFTRGYVLSPRTIFKDIHKLPAGHELVLDADIWQLQIKPWWDADHTPSDIDGDEAVVDALDEHLTRAVSDRLIADVPIGTLLSGGIDSSLITAIASKVRGEGVKAFTIGFSDSPAHDETPFAKMVAEQYGCDWRTASINQNEDDWLADLDDASRYYDEPFGNFTVTSQRTLSRLCREDLTVVLSGQGGDELSAGYPGRYNWVLQTEQAAAADHPRSQYAPPVDDVVSHLQHSAFLPWQGVRSVMFSDEAHAQMREAASATDGIRPYWNRHPGYDRLGNVLYTDAKTNLADYLICIEERASMSHSLEARNPFLDHRLATFMLSLPAKYKARPGTGPMSKDGIQNKWLLHALAKRYLPAEAFDRPKRGFTPPIQQWVASYAGRIAELFKETDALTAPLYSANWRQYLLAGRYEPGATMAVYYSLVFALWARRYADHIGAMVGSDTPRPTGEGPGVRGEAKPSASADPVTLDIDIDPSDRPSPRPSPVGTGGETASAMLHRVYRENDPEAIATARWFCQALRNFKPGDTIRIVGDDKDGFYRWLAEQSGLSVSGNAPSEGTVVVGLDAMRDFDTAAVAGETLLLFVPFSVAEQQLVNTLLQQVNTSAPIQGHQVAPTGGDRGVLIARCAASNVAS